jgi:hypothetical protein
VGVIEKRDNESKMSTQERTIQRTIEQTTATVNVNSKKSEMDKLVLKFFVAGCIPLNVVDSPEVRDLFPSAHYTPPNHERLTALMDLSAIQALITSLYI